MSSIFYDLETTDKSPMGQIINYSFITVGDDWEIQSELSGLVRVSRLQLPSPGAIVANRTDLLEHQKRATDSEKEAGARIVAYLCDVASKSRTTVPLIGFNSARFDLPYLRTVLIRNGINPYIRNLTNGDLLLLCRKLMVSNDRFAEVTKTDDGSNKRSCTLEHLTTRLGLLTGAQSHESRDDVVLTINLAKELYRTFGADIRSYLPNEGTHLLSQENIGSVIYLRRPEYDQEFEKAYREVPYTLLTFDQRQALWVDLERFEKGEGRRSIMWRQSREGAIYRAPERGPDDAAVSLARSAVKEFRDITTQNYFPESMCDIEANIYRLDASCRDALTDIIWNDQGERYAAIPSEDMKRIYGRYKLRVYQWGGQADDKVREILRNYALYRYGGEAIVDRFYQEGEVREEGDSPYHPTFNQMCAEAERLYLAGSREDRALLTSLIAFYQGSDLVRAASDLFAPSLPSFHAQAA